MEIVDTLSRLRFFVILGTLCTWSQSMCSTPEWREKIIPHAFSYFSIVWHFHDKTCIFISVSGLRHAVCRFFGWPQLNFIPIPILELSLFFLRGVKSKIYSWNVIFPTCTELLKRIIYNKISRLESEIKAESTRAYFLASGLRTWVSA